LHCAAALALDDRQHRGVVAEGRVPRLRIEGVAFAIKKASRHMKHVQDTAIHSVLITSLSVPAP
jgi:hypothetical protein